MTESLTALQKHPQAETSRSQRAAGEEHARGRTGWQMRGLSPHGTPDIHLSAASWRDVAATECLQWWDGLWHNSCFTIKPQMAQLFHNLECAGFTIKTNHKSGRESSNTVITGRCSNRQREGTWIKWHRVKLNHLATFHIEVSWELFRAVQHSGRGRRGDKNILQ